MDAASCHRLVIFCGSLFLPAPEPHLSEPNLVRLHHQHRQQYGWFADMSLIPLNGKNPVFPLTTQPLQDSRTCSTNRPASHARAKASVAHNHVNTAFNSVSEVHPRRHSHAHEHLTEHAASSGSDEGLTRQPAARRPRKVSGSFGDLSRKGNQPSQEDVPRNSALSLRQNTSAYARNRASSSSLESQERRESSYKCKQLTAALLQCHSAHEIHACLAQNQQHASGIGLAAAITHLGKLVEREWSASGKHIAHKPYAESPSNRRQQSHDEQHQQQHNAGNLHNSSRRMESGSRSTTENSHTTSHQQAVAALELAMSLMQPHLPGLTTRGYANCVWACSKMASSRLAATASTTSIPSNSAVAPSGMMAHQADTDVQQGQATQQRVGKQEQQQSSQPADLCSLAFDCASSLADAFIIHDKARTANDQDLSNMIYGLAVLGLGDHSVWEQALMPRLVAVVSTFRPHALSNVFWALGKLQKRPLSHVVQLLLSQSLRLIQEGADNQSVEELPLLPRPLPRGANEANHEQQQQQYDTTRQNVHSLSKAAQPGVESSRSHDGHDQQQPAKKSFGRADSSGHVGFDGDLRQLPQFLSNTTWALARLQYHDEAYMQAAEERFLGAAELANAQNISNMLWAFASLEHESTRLFSGLAAQVQQLAQAGRLDPQALSNITWAYAKAGMYDVGLFNTLSAACQATLHKFNPQDLANMAWAYGLVSHRDKQLFVAISRAAPPLLPRMDPQEVSQLLWSMATLNFTSEHMCRLVSERVARQLGAAPAGSGSGRGLSATKHNAHSHWRMQTLANVAWAYAVMRPGDVALLSAVFAQVDAVVAASDRGECDPEDDPGSSDIRHARQLFQAHMAHQLACLSGQALPPGSPAAELAPRTLEVCKQAWMQQVTRVNRSALQLSVSTVLQDMGYSCRSEQVIAGGLFCVDILLREPGIDRPIVVEVDGPFHYAANELTRPLGEHLLRNRFIRALGFVLVCIPFYEWHGLASQEDQQAYLTAKLQQAAAEARTRGLAGLEGAAAPGAAAVQAGKVTVASAAAVAGPQQVVAAAVQHGKQAKPGGVAVRKGGRGRSA